MKRKIKLWFVTAASLVLFGTVLILSTACSADWNFKKVISDNYKTNVYEVEESFESISIDSDTADITLLPAEDGKSKAVCFEKENVTHSVKVEKNTLTIKTVDERKWYDRIFDYSLDKITVYLPQSEYDSLLIRSATSDVKIPKELSFDDIDISISTGDVECYASAAETVKIKTSTGHISVKQVYTNSLNLTAATGNIVVLNATCQGDVTVSVTTGKVYLTGVTCKNLTSSGSTGDIEMEKVTATEKFTIERSTGEVEFDDCDAAEIFIETGTGDVEGSFLTGKDFETSTGTGKIEVPRNSTGGKCTIITGTGDIEIEIG